MLMVSRPTLPGEVTVSVASPGWVADPVQLVTVHVNPAPASHVVDVLRTLSGACGPKSLPVPLKSLDCLASTTQVKVAGAHGVLDGTVAVIVAMTDCPKARP